MAEQALLGAIFGDSRALDRVVDFLRPEHFVPPVHGRIYAEATKRILAGGISAPISLRTWFEGSPDVDQVGGIDYLGHLLSCTVGILNAREYASAIVDCWQRRQCIALTRVR